MQKVCAVLYCGLWRVWLYRIFPHYLSNYTIFGKKDIEHKMRACFGFSTSVSETFLILCIFERVFINKFRYSVEEPLFLSDFDETNLLDSFSENSRTWNFMKIRLVGTELFVRTDRYTNGRTERQTGRHDEANSRVSQLCERAWKLLRNFTHNNTDLSAPKAHSQ